MKCAMDERCVAGNFLDARLFDSREYIEGFGVNSSDRHYTLNISCEHDELSFVYFTRTGTWMPRSVSINEEKRDVSSFEIAEAHVHQAALRIE